MRTDVARTGIHGVTWIVVVLLAALVLTGCGGSGNGDPPAEGDPSGNPGQVSGLVLSTPDQLAALGPTGFLARLASFVLGVAHAQLTGLVPLPNVAVELVRVDESAAVIGPPVQTTFTDEDGEYSFDTVPSDGLLLVRVSGLTGTLHAFVSGPRVDVTPASEVVVRQVRAALDEDVPLSNFSRAELAALHGLVRGLSLDVAGMDLEAAVGALDTAATPVLAGLLLAYAGADADTALRGGNYGAIEFSSTLRDAALLEADGLAGGLDVASGLGMLTFGPESDVPESAFIPRELFLQEPNAPPRDASLEGQDLVPGEDLGEPVFVPSPSGQLVVADALRPGSEVAGIGAIAAGGGLLVHPLAYGRDRDGLTAAAGAGFRFAARWADPPLADPIALVDPLGGGPTLYHLVRLRHAYAGAPAPASAVLSTGAGTLVFNSSTQSRAFPGDAGPLDYGSFSATIGRNAVTIGLDDYRVSSPDPGSDLQNGLYHILSGTGLIILRRDDPDGTQIGSGVLSADGEVLAVHGSAANGPALERAVSIAIRQAGEAPPVGGVYNVVQYTAYVGGDGEEPPQTGEYGQLLRYGTLRLGEADGLIDEGQLFSRRAVLDLATAALGEAGAIAAGSAAESLVMPGTFTVGSNGSVRVDLIIEDGEGLSETLTGVGAATAAGDFVALAVRSTGDAFGQGRGMLFLLRQP